MIYHIATSADWNRFSEKEDYFPSGYPTEGFIHASKPEQVRGVIDRYYKNQKDLLLLEIDESTLVAPVVYEISTANEKYPHIYGPINRAAILKITSLESFVNPNEK
jgi:uncharacterized protein (DUF952 family)